MNSSLIQNGFFFVKTCNCGGTKNEVYKKGNIEVWMRPNRMDILVKYFGKVKKVYQITQIDECISYIKENLEKF